MSFVLIMSMSCAPRTGQLPELFAWAAAAQTSCKATHHINKGEPEQICRLARGLEAWLELGWAFQLVAKGPFLYYPWCMD